MPRTLLVALLFLAPTLARAATADLAMTINMAPTADPQNSLGFEVVVVNKGPDPTTITKFEIQTPEPNRTVCLIEAPFSNFLLAGESMKQRCSAFPTDHTGFYQFAATVAGSANDPDLANNTASAKSEWVPGPDLVVDLFAPSTVFDPGVTTTLWTLSYRNSGPFEAVDSVAHVILPIGFAFTGVPDACSANGNELTCMLGTVGPRTFVQPLRFNVVTPDRREGVKFEARATISTATREGFLDNNAKVLGLSLYRQFTVLNTSDAGSDSLREAIHFANASCTDGTPCKIAFHLGEAPAGGYHTIQPLTQLPTLIALNTVIDGRTQGRDFGDSNPNGPEVFIDGSKSANSSGLVIDGCLFDIRGLAIGNFTDAGVHVLDHDCFKLGFFGGSIAENFIGVDPTGIHPARNERGIVAAGAVSIADNIISGNRKSGIFYLAGHPANHAFIGRNTIGLDRTLKPMGNGAAGIFISTDADIVANYIAFNNGPGIAVANGSGNVDIHPNSIFANAEMGIDIGLDGPSPNQDPRPPEILSAHYDPITDTTAIELTYDDRTSTFGPVLQFYGSDAPHRSGYGDGQYYLGIARVSRTLHTLTFNALGDWRGKWVAATMTRNKYIGFASGPSILGEGLDELSTTSEFSRAVKVE